MRIGFDTFNPAGHGGNLTYTREIIKAVSALSCDNVINLVTYWRKKQACFDALGRDLNCNILNCYPNPKLLGNQLVPIINLFSHFVHKYIEHKCDLFHCTNPIYFPFGMKKVVTTIHDLIALRDEPWTCDNTKDYYQKHLEGIIKQSVLIFSVSENTKQDILKRYPGIEHKILVTPLAVNPVFKVLEKDRSFLEKYKVSNNLNYLLTVGEIQPRKNHLGMISAFESIAGSHENLLLIIIGQISNRYQKFPEHLFNRINQSKFRDRIVLLNNVNTDDLVNFYNNAMGFLYFSFYEGFGLPILEAMQCGCPVVSSNTSSMKEIADGAAIMVDPWSEESMKEGTVKLLSPEPIREVLIKKGLNRASNYSWEKTSQLTIKGYLSIIDKTH